MRRIVILLIIGAGIAAIIGIVMNFEPPAKNMYGGTNYTSAIIGADMVFVPDSNGTIKCSYPISPNTPRSDMLALDCEDGQGITYIDD